MYAAERVFSQAWTSWHLDKDHWTPTRVPLWSSANAQLTLPCQCVSVRVDGCNQHTLYDTGNRFRPLPCRAVVVSVSLACFVWIQLVHSVAILIFHSESMRVWVCVTCSNGISILPGPWTVGVWLRQILTSTLQHYLTPTPYYWWQIRQEEGAGDELLVRARPVIGK